MIPYTTILTEVHGRVGLVRLNRPQAMNALNGALMGELMEALLAFDADEEIRAIVITGKVRVGMVSRSGITPVPLPRASVEACGSASALVLACRGSCFSALKGRHRALAQVGSGG